ncbi:MAG TPA: hypothetical protein VMV21_16880, partial [Vicinamibacteria bacterium]|nr:hypothetical protein [Vicinamibacteria bacterium]
MMRPRCAALLGLFVAVGCGGERAPEPSSAAQKPTATPFDAARKLLEQGQTDEALAALANLPAGAESFYLQ